MNDDTRAAVLLAALVHVLGSLPDYTASGIPRLRNRRKMTFIYRMITT